MVCRTIARLADGDARMAITTLRVAARKASKEGLSMIPSRIVEASTTAAELELTRKTYSKFNDHQRVVHYLLRDEGELVQRELHE